jgi:hypothetical protein
MRHALLAVLIGIAAPSVGESQEPPTKKAEVLTREVDPKLDAERRPVRELAAGIAEAGRVDPSTMRAYHARPVEQRRRLFQLPDDDDPLPADLMAEVAGYVLAQETDKDVRVRAAARLGRLDMKKNALVGKALVRALADTDAEVRASACQSLWQHGDAALAPQVRPRLKDDDREVRRAAVRALGVLGDVKSVPDIVKVYEADEPGVGEAVTFAESLAALGETKVSVPIAVAAMASDNWNVRYFAVKALGDVKGDAAVPPLVDCLRLELKRITAGEKMTGFDERIYKTACKLLADRTGEKHGLDPVAWADWWATARKRYDGAEWVIDRDAAKRAFAAYQRK